MQISQQVLIATKKTKPFVFEIVSFFVRGMIRDFDLKKSCNQVRSVAALRYDHSTAFFFFKKWTKNNQTEKKNVYKTSKTLK